MASVAPADLFYNFITLCPSAQNAGHEVRSKSLSKSSQFLEGPPLSELTEDETSTFGISG
jgi:hypothetical protein